ncbi:helix-turn-helix domain-containing protein [Nocardia sp. NPDC020380]|uniref:helix-turn-helix domain-containing protein n=1 Tax=Nocardia sp. NPDC020380 TaxID=3364309 RepID=UPI00379D32DB
MPKATSSFGDLLRVWRRAQGVTQLELSIAAGVSTRHISFLETGRATPSRPMTLRLAHELDVPARERNTLLIAAGYAPDHVESVWDAPEMARALQSVDLLLDSHMPFPAMVTDSMRNIVRANPAIEIFTEGLPPHLLGDDGTGGNVARMVLHPEGLSTRLLNLPQIRAAMLESLRAQLSARPAPRLAALLLECESYPCPPATAEPASVGEVLLSGQLRRGDRVLSFHSALSTFGTAANPTIADLTLELVYPADEQTAEFMHRFANGQRPASWNQRSLRAQSVS